MSLPQQSQTSPIRSQPPLPISTSPITFTKKRVDRKWLLIILSMILLGVGIHSYAHFIYFNPSKILARSFNNLAKSSTFLFTAETYMSYDTEANSAIQIPISFSSAISGIYSNENHDPRFSISGTLNAGKIPLAQFELKKVETSAYIFIKSLSDLGFIDNEKVTERWISLDLTNLPQNSTQVQFFPQVPLTETQRNKLLELMKNNPPMTVHEVFPEEESQGKVLRHYTMDVQKQNLIVCIESFVVDEPSRARVKKLMDQIEFNNTEIWISKADDQLVRMVVQFSRRSSEVGAPAIHLSVDLNFRNFGQTVSIQAPKSSTPVDSILKEVVHGIQISPSEVSM